MSVVAKRVEPRRLVLWCPGCDDAHLIAVHGEGAWGWNGAVDETITVSPSILVYGHKYLLNPMLEGDALTAPENIGLTPRCHSFVREGRWEFLSDSTHELAGQTVSVVPLPEDIWS